jgi:hypothetical protein
MLLGKRLDAVDGERGDVGAKLDHHMAAVRQVEDQPVGWIGNDRSGGNDRHNRIGGKAGRLGDGFRRDCLRLYGLGRGRFGVRRLALGIGRRGGEDSQRRERQDHREAVHIPS